MKDYSTQHLHIEGTHIDRPPCAFSGDSKQVVPLLKAALSHKGTAILNIISPCVTFNDHQGSTKSYQWVKDHDIPLHEIGYIPEFEDISVDYEEGTTTEVRMHDGARILLKKLKKNFEPTDKVRAIQVLDEGAKKGQLVTGLLYLNPEKQNFIEQSHMHAKPLTQMNEADVRPPKSVLDSIMESLA